MHDDGHVAQGLVAAQPVAQLQPAHAGHHHVGEHQVDADPIREAVAAFKLGHAKDSLALHHSERWREKLLAGDDAMQAFINEHEGIDVQQLRSLVRAARKDVALAPELRSGRAYRDLFQFIKTEQLRSTGSTDTQDEAEDE